jgi:hypothetical protein
MYVLLIHMQLQLVGWIVLKYPKSGLFHNTNFFFVNSDLVFKMKMR